MNVKKLKKNLVRKTHVQMYTNNFFRAYVLQTLKIDQIDTCSTEWSNATYEILASHITRLSMIYKHTLHPVLRRNIL